MLTSTTDDRPDLSEVRRRFAALAELPDDRIDLAEGAFLIAAEEYPGLDVSAWLRRLDSLAAQVKPRLQGLSEESDRLSEISRFLHAEVGLRGNEDDYYDPRNSFLNDVLDRGLGIPISLSVVYLEVASRLGIPVRGVGFPAHFLVKYCGDRELFIDPFHGGTLLTRQGCAALLDRLTGGQVELEPQYLHAVTNRQILLRMLNNLKAVYLKASDYTRALAAVDRLLLLSPGLTREYRDRGAIYLQMEALRSAVSDFECYLRLGPEEEDREVITNTVIELRKRIAQFH